MPHYLRALGFAGLAWWISFWVLNKWTIEEDEDIKKTEKQISNCMGELAFISLIPAFFAFLASI